MGIILTKLATDSQHFNNQEVNTVPTDYSKKFADLFDLLSDANNHKSEVESILIGGENYTASLEFSIGVIKFLTERLNAIAHVKPNPHEWENRYSTTKAEIANEKFYNDIYGEPNIVLNNGNKISELSVNYVNKAYNYMNPNTRIGEDIKVKDQIDLLANGEKITLNNIIKGYSDILKVKKWVDANFSKYFDSNKMCIMPCQVGCQVGCQIAQQAPNLTNSECAKYPTGIGILGTIDVEPRGSLSNAKLKEMYIYICGDHKNMDDRKSYLTDAWEEDYKQFTDVLGLAESNTIRKIREYNKEREAFNRAQIGKDPCIWKPYYSITAASFVLPVTEEWLDCDKIIERINKAANITSNDDTNIYNKEFNLLAHARWSKYGRYIFVSCEADFLITTTKDNKEFEKYTYNYYRFKRYASRNYEYRYFNHKLGKGYDKYGRKKRLDPPWDSTRVYKENEPDFIYRLEDYY